MAERQNGAQIRAAIYARISSDPRGKHEGVDRQVADCKALAKTLGWTIVATFIDNDISAYSGAPRPAYREMLDAVRTGEIAGIVAWHTDRLHRRPTELEEFISLAEATNLQVRTVKAGAVDLSTSGGRMVARMLGAAARQEIDHARERMQAAKDQAILDGKYRGGPRPYGYDEGGMVIREAEAKVIREATDGVLAGRTLAGIARDLNQRGLKTSSGREWTYSRLKEMLVRPRNAGLAAHGLPGRKTYRSLITKERHPVEIVGKAAWPAVVPEDQWRALVDLLTDPGRRSQDGNDTRWLGSGLYICGVCGGKLRPAPTGGTKTRPYSRKYLYRCTESAHLTISTGPTDEYVKTTVAGYLRDPRIIAGMHPTDEHLTEDRKQRSVLAARIARFDSDYSEGTIPAALWASSTAKAKAELADVDARMTKALRRSTSSAVALANDPGEAFLNAPVDIQRAVMATIVRVRIISAREAGVPVGGAWTDRRVVIEPIEAEPDPT
jgi:DNA invertase Pin-like site-specific DNA recombinase